MSQYNVYYNITHAIVLQYVYCNANHCILRNVIHFKKIVEMDQVTGDTRTKCNKFHRN